MPYRKMYRDEVSMKLLRELKPRRLRLGLTQGDLARMLGASQSTIERYESGKYFPSAPMIVRLAEIFGYDISSSVNYRYRYVKITPSLIKRELRRYGLSYRELAQITGYDFDVIRNVVNMRKGEMPEVLSAILKVIDDEHRSFIFRCELLDCKRRGSNSARKAKTTLKCDSQSGRHKLWQWPF